MRALERKNRFPLICALKSLYSVVTYSSDFLTLQPAIKGNLEMKLVNTLLIAASAFLLSAAVISPASHAYAQDAADDSVDEASPDAKGTAADIGGCWDGNAHDVDDNVQFNFVQEGSKIENSSTFSFTFTDDGNSTVSGVMKGTVSGNKVKFSGSMGKKCKLKGSGTADLSSSTPTMEGKYKFSGKCGPVENGDFSVSKPCSM